MTIRVRQTLEAHGPATAVILSSEQVAELGGGKRAAVAVTIEGRTTRLRLGVMGGLNMIGLSKAARAELGVEIGDEVEATIALDTAERTVEIPDDLRAALDAEPGLRQAFDALAFTHRKEHVRSVADAKRPETRERRVAAVVAALRGGAEGAVRFAPHGAMEAVDGLTSPPDGRRSRSA